MKLIDSKSVLLGLGLGIIITSLLGIIFFVGYKPQLSDAEIISYARKLGMVDGYESGHDIRRREDGSLVFTIHEDDSFTDVSKRLYDAGIIESSIEFEIIIKKEKLENAIKPGEYTINYNDDTKKIIEKITELK
ncbi:MAG TPA: endolytic transglycosylase MltG [Clostridiaceae bacterium]|nr:endolytic transglycosylase MltG [Clostridiaceae bacterium]